MQRISAGKCMPIKEAQDASCASLIAFVRAMLFVDDGTRITPLSLHGEGGVKDKWERLSQVRRLREHPIHRCAVPLLQTITPCGATVNENGFLLSLGWRRRHSSFPLGRLSPLSKLFWSPLLNHILSRAYAP